MKIPGTAEGLPAIRQMISEGNSINVTLLFSVDRYGEVMEAYLAGLEANTGDLSKVSSVASFFVSRVDTEADRRLDAIGTPEALGAQGQGGRGQRPARLRAVPRDASPVLVGRRSPPAGAQVQRPLWASTSTKDPSFPDTLYVDTLIGPDTVNTMPDATLDDFDDHGTLARTVDADFAGAHAVLDRLAAVGVDLADVTATLEDEGVASFSKSFDELLESLSAKAADLA